MEVSVRPATKILKGVIFHAGLVASTDGLETHFATVRSIVHYEVAMKCVSEIYRNCLRSQNLVTARGSFDAGKLVG